MRLFCSMMHVASGRVRRKPVRLCQEPICIFYTVSLSGAGDAQNCVSPEEFKAKTTNV